MWIDNRISRPLTKGYYTTLVDFDGFGNLKEYQKEYYNGLEFDWCMSNAQYIRFWWASEEDYEIIMEHLEEEKSKYLKQLEEESKNFGGLKELEMGSFGQVRIL